MSVQLEAAADRTAAAIAAAAAAAAAAAFWDLPEVEMMSELQGPAECCSEALAELRLLAAEPEPDNSALALERAAHAIEAGLTVDSAVATDAVGAAVAAAADSSCPRLQTMVC